MTPRMTAPAWRSRATSGASRSATIPARSLVPASQRKPATCIELLMLSGTPCKGSQFFSVAHRGFGHARLPSRAIDIDMDKGIKPGIQLLDPGEMRFDQFDRRKFFLPDLLSHGYGRKES